MGGIVDNPTRLAIAIRIAEAMGPALAGDLHGLAAALGARDTWESASSANVAPPLLLSAYSWRVAGDLLLLDAQSKAGVVPHG
jgi:hypothetical protein